MKRMVRDAIGAMTVMLIMFVALVLAGTIESNYTRTAKVAKVESGIVYLDDEVGNVWEWAEEEADEFTEGQNVKMKMNTNGTTEYIYDDIIKSIEVVE